MFASKKTGFCKNEDCPSSHELLDFQKGETPNPRGGEISRHLRSCEFCSAEVEFYSHYPQTDISNEQNEIAEIPAPLFELAEALLKNRQADARSLDSLLKEKSGLVLDKA
jgi:hypothetical protein